MQHTVIAFFDTYSQADTARDALVAAGLARDDIALQARCEPTYASDATSAAETSPASNEGLLASIERFFESLFVSGPPSHETAQYAEAVRRGAVMLSVDAATDVQAELARTTLEGMGPIDIEERASTWRAPDDDAVREHSPLEELGLRRSTRVASQQGPVRSYPRDPRAAADAEVGGGGVARSTGEAAATAVAAGCAPGMGAVFASGHGDAPAAQAPASPPPPVPDEYLQNEEDFHGEDDGGKRGR